MPIVEQPFQQTIYSGADQSLFNQPVQESTPGTMETLKAAFAQGNTLGSLANRIVNQDPELDAPPDWKPEDHLDGFEDADKSTITRLVNARTPGELVGIKNRIQQERQDKETLQKSGALGFWSTLGFGLIDPTFLAAAMVPEVAIANKIKTAKLLTSIARGTAGAAAYEGGMQATQETRTAQESAVNIGAGMLLSAALGHLANSVPRKQLAEIATKTDIENGIPKSAGAAATNEIGTLAEEGYAMGGETVAKVMKSTGLLGTDADILMTSEFATARNAVKELADIPGITGENMRGIANPISVESNVDAAYAQLADLSDEINSGWKKYTERVPSSERISKVEYEAMHADALRNGDRVAIPEMQAAVTRQRAMFEGMYQEAQELGLAEDPVKNAQAALEKRHIDKYIKAESRQLYADYSARTNQAIKEADAAALLKQDPTAPNFDASVKTVAQKSALIRSQLELAQEAAKSAHEINISNLRGKVDSAQAMHDAELVSLKKELELNKEALAQQNELLAKAASKETSTLKQNVRDHLALTLSTERSVKAASIEKADAVLEKAKRLYDKERIRIRSEVEPGKRQEAILRARIAFKDAVAVHQSEIGKANTNAAKAMGELRAKYGKDELRAAAKVERETPSLRTAYQYGRNIGKAKLKLQKTRQALAKEISAERKRFSNATKHINESSKKELKRLSPLSRNKFMKLAMGSTETDIAEAIKLRKLLKDADTGDVKSRITIPTLDENSVKKLLGSKSYFTRMWDANKIRDNMTKWTQKLTEHFAREGADKSEIHAAVQDVTDQLTHMDVGQSNWQVKINTPNSGRLQDRVLNVRDNEFKEFLVNDPMKVAKAYVKDLAPKLELAKKFGDTDMKQAFENIKSEHGVKKQKIIDSDLPQNQKNEKIKKLDEQREQAQDALLRVRDRILGTAGRLSPTAGKAERATVMAARNFRAYVASTKMGGTALTGGVMDTSKIIAEYGFAPTISRIAKLATSPEFRALSAANARRMGSMVEVSMQRRLNIAMEGGVTEGWAQHLTEGLYKWTGLSHTTDFNRMLACSLMEDRVLAAAQKAANGTLGKYEMGKLASLGLGTNELKAIAKEVAKQRTEIDGVRVSGSALWKDQELARVYDRAILRESKIAVQQPGAADRVWWMDSELGKLLGQLKSFTLSSPGRMLTPALQMAGSGGLEGWARFGRFAGFMMIGGALTHMLRQKLSGREIDASPQALASNALTESGLAGILPDIIQPIGKSYAGTQWGKAVGLGEMFGTSKYGDRSLWSAYLGPSIGSAEDIAGTAKRLTDGGVSASDLHALRRNLPWQNAWFMRRGINAVEGEMAENLGLPGSDVASFGERLTRTQALTQ